MKKWLDEIKDYAGKLNKLLGSKKYHFRKCNSNVVPRKKGIYVIYKKTERSPLYVGISDNLRRRLFQAHLKANSQFATYYIRAKKLKDRKTLSKRIKDNCYFRFMPYDSKKLRWLEHFAMAVLRPKIMIEKEKEKN